MDYSSIYAAFERMWQHAILKFNNCVPTETFNGHIENETNPHNVTKEQIGLDNVDNTADLDKPISNAIQVALDKKSDSDHQHAASEVGALSIAGGTMEGTIIVNGIVLTEGVDYGSDDPSSGVLGQLYFKKVTE